MSRVDQKLCAWGGPFFVVCLGAGLLLSGFVPPPSPDDSAAEIAEHYSDHKNAIRTGMILGLLGLPGWITLVGAISVQLRRIRGISRLGPYLQLGGGSIGVLTVMFPIMIFAIASFRPDRDPDLTQLLNDAGWLIIIPAFPTFIAQFLGIATAVLQDKSPTPVFPRWTAYFNMWVGLLFMPGGCSYYFKTGPLAWDGVFAFWLAAGAFFVWLLVMTWLVLRAIETDTDDSGAGDPDPAAVGRGTGERVRPPG